MSRKIPIRNFYYILCYVWEMLPDSLLESKDLEQCSKIEDLYGNILAVGMSRLIKRGLTKNYIVQEEQIYGIRGKLNLSASIKNGRLPLGYTQCITEEYTTDIIENRLLKGAIRTLLSSSSLANSIRSELESVWERIHEINDTVVSLSDFRKVQLHGNTSQYSFLLEIARLIYSDRLITEESGTNSFNDIRDSEFRMGELFEKFIYNFCVQHLSQFSVSRPHINWFNVEANSIDKAYLPVMRSDMVLRAKGLNPFSMIVDMKYYSKLFSSRFSTDKLISGHLYQILTYLNNSNKAEPQRKWHGMLLYPVVNQKVNLNFQMDNLPLHIRTIDLDQDWWEIEQHLKDILVSESTQLAVHQVNALVKTVHTVNCTFIS